MPPPLIPSDVEIPRLPWVPIYADRLWDSNFWSVATDAEFRAAFCLWLKSWNQTPPGSLPTDDRQLCRLAELSGNLAKWHKVKRIALHHWVECDDGRLYHPVIADLVISAEKKLNANKRRTMAATASRWKRSGEGVRNGLRDGDDLKRRVIPPLYPPRKGEGDEVFSTNGSEGKRSGGPAPSPLNPKIIGHALPCACPNCTRWVEQERAS